MATTQMPIDGVFNTATGELVGFAALSGPEIPLVLGGGTISNITYDAQNRCSGYTSAGVTYTISYAADRIVRTDSSGATYTAMLDSSGRFSGVSA